MNDILTDFSCNGEMTREKALDMVLKYGRLCKKYGSGNNNIISDLDSLIDWDTILSVITKDEALKAYKKGITGK